MKSVAGVRTRFIVVLARLGVTAVLVLLANSLALGQTKRFQIEELTINGLHRAIQNGETTCKQVVQAYIDRARAYNGMCTALVTKDGAPIPPVTGVVRAGLPIKFPTETVAVSKVLPDFDQYRGLPIEFGRMESTVSDPGVQQQYGMRIGIPEAGQLNALETLNIRGERSVTCKGEFDKAPAAGPLPPGAPAVCEQFRKMPDALERAAELDKQYGRKPRSEEPADVLRGFLGEELV
jgi:amidase